MEEETIDVAPSEDNGNVPAEAPIETTPEPVVETVETTPTEPELYELPDGRKVDAETLSKEWKEHFYPEYTRKSQALAAKETQQTAQAVEPTNTLTDDWVPKSYAELVQIAKQGALAEIEQVNQAQIQKQQEIETKVANELAEIKVSNPTVNENELFLNATKYRTDLKGAMQIMKDMAGMVKNVQTTTAANIAKRNDPVSVSNGNSGGNVPDASQFASAAEYLQSLQ